MTPEEAQWRRELAYKNALLGLQQLSSHELSPNNSRAAGVLYELQQWIGQIETATEAASQQRHAESEQAAQFRDQYGRYTQPGAAAIPRGEPQRPPPESEEDQIARTMEQMRAGGLGRI